MAEYPHARHRGVPKFMAAIAAFVVSGGAYVANTGTAEAAIQCDGTITANVAVLDSPTVFNRLGAQNPNWITYALLRDVVEAIEGPLELNPCHNDMDADCALAKIYAPKNKWNKVNLAIKQTLDCIRVSDLMNTSIKKEMA